MCIFRHLLESKFFYFQYSFLLLDFFKRKCNFWTWDLWVSVLIESYRWAMVAGFLARGCYDGIRTWDLWVSVLIESYRRAMVGGTPEFLGQLIASLLVAQWSERLCTSLVVQGSIPGMSRSESAITRGKTQMMLLPPTSFSFSFFYSHTNPAEWWFSSHCFTFRIFLF
jgi:hypothetical protein